MIDRIQKPDKPSKKQPAKRSQRRQQDVHAAHGEWTTVEDPGDKLIEAIGYFDKNNREHALGTARFLQNKGITRDFRQPEEAGGEALIVRVSREENDKIARFEEWAHTHNLLPHRKEKLAQHEQKKTDARRDAWLSRIAQEEKREWAFKPVSQKLVEWGIENALTWETVEGAGTASTIVAVTDRPEVAFQVALYLRDKGYADPEDFRRIERDVKQKGQSGQEYRLSVVPTEVDKFLEKFPGAGTSKTLSGDIAGWLDRLITLSQKDRRLPAR